MKNHKNNISSKMFIASLLYSLIKTNCSGVIIGDTGSGKTYLQQKLCKYISGDNSIITIEDLSELKLKTFYPSKDIYSLLINTNYTFNQAFKDALDLKPNWIMTSTLGAEDFSLLTNVIPSDVSIITSANANNVWDIPNHIITSDNRDIIASENNFYSLFDYAIKVKAEYTDTGIKRFIDQICFFDRYNDTNCIYNIIKDGKIVNTKIPKKIIKRFYKNNLFNFLNLYLKVIEMGK